MSLLTELKVELAAVLDDLSKQVGQLKKYQAAIDDTAYQVENALAGSDQQFNAKMTQQLASTRQQIDQTMAGLQAAADKISYLMSI